MASIREVVEGLTILSEYANPMASGKTGLDVQIGGAEHDIIFGPDVVDLPESKRIELENLGWHFDSECDSWSRFC